MMALTLDQMLTSYLVLRGMKLPVVTTGRKILEEGQELVDAIASDEIEQIELEIGDVALTLAVIARKYKLTIEDCIASKTFHDLLRGEPHPNKNLAG